MKTTYTTTTTFLPDHWHKEDFSLPSVDREDLSHYHFNYSYQYPWVDTNDNTISEVEINQNTSLKLTDKHLEIIQRDHRSVVDLHFVQKISLQFRKLFLPITVGGIIAPLSLVAIHANILKPISGFSVLIVAILLFYYGYQGSYQIEIVMKGFQKNILLEEKTKSIERFIKKANQFLLKMRR